MLAYVARRLLLMIPTLFGIMLANFLIIQAAPGGPVETTIARVKGQALEATSRVGGGGAEAGRPQTRPGGLDAGAAREYRGARGLDPALIAQLEKMYGFDQPAHTRFFTMLKRYLVFDFGTSFFRDRKVIDLIAEKLPVSISLGLWTMLLAYLISIPLGIAKAVRDGSSFDVWTTGAVILGYSIPGFLLAVLLIVLFAGGSYLHVFPLRGLTSANWAQLSWAGRVVDYVWHLVLPVTAILVSGFATITLLTKNSFLEEINKQYVITARSKGLTRRRVLYGHVFRNAMLLVVSGFPAALVGILFTGELLIEIIFSLDGLGLLGFEAAINRDYPVMFATVYIYTVVGLILTLITDLMYVAIDPRIDFASRDR
jgi:microcin C transport system permease protein